MTYFFVFRISSLTFTICNVVKTYKNIWGQFSHFCENTTLWIVENILLKSSGLYLDFDDFILVSR